jgi:hypothetical protein
MIYENSSLEKDLTPKLTSSILLPVHLALTNKVAQPVRMGVIMSQVWLFD